MSDLPIEDRRSNGGNKPAIRVSVETITPEVAKDWFDLNINNRTIRWSKVHEMATSVLRGDWVLNGESFKFDSDGRQIDGQHRDLALIEAGKTDSSVSIESLVVRGLPPSSQLTMDQGAKRTFPDTLTWLGEKNAVTLGSSVRIFANFLRTGIVTSQQHQGAFTKEQLLDVLEQYSGIRQSLYPPQGDRCSQLLTRSISAVLFYTFRRIEDEDANYFFYMLGGGEGEIRGALSSLRNTLQDNLARKHGQMNTRHRTALTIKAWNAWRTNSGLEKVSWRPGGSRPEPYPQIDGLLYDETNGFPGVPTIMPDA